MQGKVIVDIVFFLVIILAVIVGAVIGFSRSLKYLVFLPIILLTILVASWVMPLLKNTHMFYGISRSVEKSLNKKPNEVLDLTFMKDKDSGKVYVGYPHYEEGAIYEIDNLPNDIVRAKVQPFKGIIDRNASTETTHTLRKLIADEITLHIVSIISHIFWLLAFTALFVILRIATRNWHDSESVGEQVTDRVLGLITSAVLVIIFMMFLLSIARVFLHNSQFIAMQSIKDSAIVGKIYAYNPIGKVFARSSFGIIGLVRRLLSPANNSAAMAALVKFFF